MATFCPHCDEEIENEIGHEWTDNYEDDFDFACPRCGKTMVVYVEIEPAFLAHKKT